uniref:Uncharacterized protein n=1 Tax=Lygus hesperus TaxID=30085 RepID=A0A0A9YU82_LYGHE
MPKLAVKKRATKKNDSKDPEVKENLAPKLPKQQGDLKAKTVGKGIKKPPLKTLQPKKGGACYLSGVCGTNKGGRRSRKDSWTSSESDSSSSCSSCDTCSSDSCSSTCDDSSTSSSSSEGDYVCRRRGR